MRWVEGRREQRREAERGEAMARRARLFLSGEWRGDRFVACGDRRRERWHNRRIVAQLGFVDTALELWLMWAPLW